MYQDIEEKLGADIWDKWDTYWALKDSGGNYQAYKREHPELTEYGKIKDAWGPVIADNVVRFGSHLHDIPVNIRPSAGGSYGQEQLIQGIQNQNAGLPQLSWAQWQQLLGVGVSRLVEDYVYSGEEVPYAAMQSLEAVGKDMGIYDADTVLKLAELSMQAR
jgi:hypothetical protein